MELHPFVAASAAYGEGIAMTIEAALTWFVLHEPLLHRAASWIMIAVGVSVIIVEVGFGARAPYGRHAALPAAKWYGPTISAKAAWIFQESFAFFVPFGLLVSGASEPRCLASPVNRILLAMFMSHYAYRAFAFPLRMRGGKPMPIGICLLAAAFCLWNGYVQGRAWTALEPCAFATIADFAALLVGTCVWALGLAINLHSDGVLRNLRRPGESGYKVPRGGAFEWVSGANYFGEIVEWSGYALASKAALPAVAFAFFTFANTAPRAHHHHLWYRAKFEDYPRERCAVIPYVW